MNEWKMKNPLKAWYSARGMSQVDVAAMLGVGVQAVQRWISGASVPNDANYCKMASVMEIAVIDLTAAWDAWRVEAQDALIAQAKAAWNG